MASYHKNYNYNANNHHRSSGPLPDRWLYCPRTGRNFIVNIFMATKTPLDFKFDNKIEQHLRFTPTQFFQMAFERNVKFGLWIDLTNTERYYDKSEVLRNNCQYHKIACVGRGKCPNASDVRTFIRLVDQFVYRYPNEKILVHCTHGFNRTGFLIVSYLVERMNFYVGDALQLFAGLRPPGIYKDDYIVELFRRYDKVQNAPRAPMKPNWVE